MYHPHYLHPSLPSTPSNPTTNLSPQAIFIPALIALALYIALTYLLFPFIRRHRQRYSQYLPVQTPGSTAHDPLADRNSGNGSSIRLRIADALGLVFLPSRWRWQRLLERNSRAAAAAAGRRSEEELFDDEEGEGMVGFDIDERRRGALERRRSSIGEEDRRLSRELEEGFKDDSDEEEEGEQSGHRR